MSVVLSEHLPLLATAPEGIKKLRGLILELAVRGKLVPQDPNDEPASELLKRIAQVRARMEAEGVCKKSKAPPLSGDEVWPSALEPGWSWTNLATVALINPRNSADDLTEASFVPMAMIGNRFEGSHEQETRKWSEIKQGFTHFAEGDVGVAKITPCFENSKACVFTDLRNGIGAGTTELHIVRPLGNTLSPRYVLAYLKAPMFLAVGETKMTGTAGQKRLPKDFLESNPFPLPPLAEQHRIVAKVDELMVLCDRLEAEQTDAASAHTRLVETLLGTLTQSTDAGNLATNWQRLAEHFDSLLTTEASVDALKQNILQLAVTGQLVPQDDQDASVTEKLVKTFKLRGQMVKERALPARCLTDEPWLPNSGFGLPVTWQCVGFDHLAALRANALKAGPFGSALKKSFYVPSGYKIYGQEQVINQDASYGDYYISEAKFLELKSCEVLPGDVLISLVGTIGKVLILPANAQAGIINPRLIKMSLNPELADPSFIKVLLASPWVRAFLFAESHGSTMDVLNLSILRALPVPLPPLDEQRRIVAKVDELMALCDCLKADLASARQRQATLAGTLIESALEAA